MSTRHPARTAPYGPRPTRCAGIRFALAELALDLRWSWNHAADAVWRQLDPALWELTHNPWAVCCKRCRGSGSSSRRADPAFRRRVDELYCKLKRQAAQAPTWFQQAHPRRAAELCCVFQYGIHAERSAAHLLRRARQCGGRSAQGRQRPRRSGRRCGAALCARLFSPGDRPDGAQQALFPYNDPGQLPITPVRASNGEWLRLRLDVPGHPIWLRAWQVQVGRARLYLLDSNDAANFRPTAASPASSMAAGRICGCMQELVLGIGGWRLLAALGIEPEVCHLNEGHAALAVLERARSFMQASGQTFRSGARRDARRQSLHHAYGGGGRI